MPDAPAPFAIVVPGPELWLLILAVCLAPTLLWVVAGRVVPARMARLPEGVRVGVPLFTGLAGTVIGIIGVWLVSSNGAWVGDDTLTLRASRAFVAQVPLHRLQPQAARPLQLAELSPEGRIRAPRYAAGWYRDGDGRRIFLLYAGAEMHRLPTDGEFDLAFGVHDEAALATLDKTGSESP